jgi:large subunit ribosomal protein L9
MKVILLQDVAKIGKRFSVVQVPDGYALNQLIPKKWAQPATPENLKRVLKHHQVVASDKEAGDARFDEVVALLAEKQITVPADANEQSHLFQAIHEKDIVSAAAAVGISIDAPMLKILTPIKSLGDHEVQLVGNNKNHLFTITIIKK